MICNLLLVLVVLVSSTTASTFQRKSFVAGPSSSASLRSPVEPLNHELLNVPRGGAVSKPAAKPVAKAKAKSASACCAVFNKATVVELHGLSMFFFGAVFLLESFGVAVPVIGPEALLKGWDTNNAAMMFTARFVSTLMLALGLAERKFAGNVDMQKIFVLYHIPTAILTLISSADTAKDNLGYLYAIIIALFCVGGIIAE